MPFRIMLLEDNAWIKDSIVDKLRELGYVVDGFFRIDQVKEYFDEHMDEIDCLIVDMNMDDRWLGEYRNESLGGFLAGAVWLERFVLAKRPNVPIVIHSGFIDLIRHEKSLFSSMKNITFADKAEGFDGLLAAIERVLGVGGR